jgi:hypothetical protein
MSLTFVRGWGRGSEKGGGKKLENEMKGKKIRQEGRKRNHVVEKKMVEEGVKVG